MRQIISAILSATVIILSTGCGTMTDKTKVEGLKVAKCLSACAINCGASSAIAATSCKEYSESEVKSEAINAARCLASCAIRCGIQAAAAHQGQ